MTVTALPGKLLAPFAVPKAATSGRPAPGLSVIVPATESGIAEELLTEKRRRKIWELSEAVHCSIIGTCLSTGELRQLLIRLKIGGAETASDHDLHGKGVVLARNRDAGGKLLNKALDRRHHLAIHQFAKGRSETAVSEMWAEAVKRGDIPGAYWAVLTHPATSDALLRQVFGEVHMLSHLVGAANRADIRRLHQLEQENAELTAKIARQQAQLRDAVVVRDAKIRELMAALSQRIEAEATAKPPDEATSEAPALDALVAALERGLAAETARRERCEERLEQSGAALRQAEEACRQALSEREALHQELAVAEESLKSLFEDDDRVGALDLQGLSLLYVGGRPNQISHLRALSERASARFLRHDGGIDERSGQLPGLISRADIALFPVDCISHDAALMVKRLCRQSGKPWIPLRTASLAAFLAALAPLASAPNGVKTG